MQWTPELRVKLVEWRAQKRTTGEMMRSLRALGHDLTRNQVLGAIHRLADKGYHVDKLRNPVKGRPLPAPRAKISNGINRPHVPLTAYTGPPGAGCKWPHDDFIARIRAHLDPFCSAPTIAGTSWCGEHHRRAYARA